MIDASNLVSLTGGIVAAPEKVTENILKFRLAVDYAGSEKGTDNNSGYFDVVYYLNNDDGQRNAKWVLSQVDEGKMNKGSQIRLVGRLVHERWTADEKKNSRVTVVAESIQYVKGAAPKEGAAGGGTGGAATTADQLPDF